MPVVVVSGMRQTGKSTLLQHEPALADRRYVSLDDFATYEEARSNPEAFLTRAARLSIDEAHKLPELLEVIKQLVDADRVPGRFLLTGSANFLLLNTISETLAGRALYLTLWPFNRRELLQCTSEEPALTRLFREGNPGLKRDLPPVQAQDLIRGGMPVVCLPPPVPSALWFQGYEQTYLERDVRALSQVGDLAAFRRVLRLAALRTGGLLNVSQLGRDAQMPASTASRYLSLLETSCVLTSLPPYLGNRVSRLIKSPKLYVCDSGLAHYLGGGSPTDELSEVGGSLLETYVAQNLSATLAARWPEARLYFWHVQGRHEVDFIIESGRECLAVEVKSAARWTERDLRGLRAFLAATPHCRAAVLGYMGRERVDLGARLWAVPLSSLLS